MSIENENISEALSCARAGVGICEYLKGANNSSE
jgi:hypothetical protein